MAEIYLALATTDLGATRLSVVKQILPELSGNDRFAEMLIGEAKLAARLNHANIVQVFDLGRHEGILFIAMEYVEGFDLNNLLRRCSQAKVPFPVDFALFVVMEAVRGLGYAHRLSDDSGPLGIVHRDVSPSNVLVSFEGEVKVCDFGIARANDMADLVSEDGVVGKAGYMSPEHARGEPLDARADVFATGILLWELLCGRKLYKPPRDAAQPSLAEQARKARIPDLPPRGLPNEETLHSIVKKALAPNRDDRFPSAQTLLRELEEYIGRSRLMVSPIRFGEWLRDNFEEKVFSVRRSRERAAESALRGRTSVVETYDSFATFLSSVPASTDAVESLAPIAVGAAFGGAADRAEVGAEVGAEAGAEVGADVPQESDSVDGSDASSDASSDGDGSDGDGSDADAVDGDGRGSGTSSDDVADEDSSDDGDAGDSSDGDDLDSDDLDEDEEGDEDDDDADDDLVGIDAVQKHEPTWYSRVRQSVALFLIVGFVIGLAVAGVFWAFK